MRSKHFNGWDDENEQVLIVPDYDEKLTLLDKLEILMKGARNSEISEKFQNDYSEYILSISEILKLTQEETIMLCPYLSITTQNFDLDNIAEYFGFSSLRMVSYYDNVVTLHKKGYLEKVLKFGDTCYCLSEEALISIGHNKPVVMHNIDNLCPMDFINEMQDKFHSMEKDKMDVLDMYEFIAELLSKNHHLKLVRFLLNPDFNNEDRF